VIEQEGNFEIAGVVDNNFVGGEVYGYPILGGDTSLIDLRSTYEFALITVGQIKTPEARIHLFDTCRALGYFMPTIVSPRAYVSRSASVGNGTIIMHDALINSRSVLGENCIINTKSLIEHDVIVKNHCHISTAAVINGGSVIESGTFVGSNSVVKEAVVVGEKSFIKAGSIFIN